MVFVNVAPHKNKYLCFPHWKEVFAERDYHEEQTGSREENSEGLKPTLKKNLRRQSLEGKEGGTRQGLARACVRNGWVCLTVAVLSTSGSRLLSMWSWDFFFFEITLACLKPSFTTFPPCANKGNILSYPSFQIVLANRTDIKLTLSERRAVKYYNSLVICEKK